jgi:hypothetical protein
MNQMFHCVQSNKIDTIPYVEVVALKQYKEGQPNREVFDSLTK